MVLSRFGFDSNNSDNSYSNNSLYCDYLHVRLFSFHVNLRKFHVSKFSDFDFSQSILIILEIVPDGKTFAEIVQFS